MRVKGDRTKKRYLIFDARCSVCKSLAKAIEEAAGSKLEEISIHDAKARTLLDQAYSAGWAIREGFVE
jgi:predicted DCC family thiol-disulfide oxidoreductase YuxK